MRSVRPTVTRVFGVLVVGLTVLLLAGQLLGQPVLLGYVTTGSMRPTLNPGDGFVAIPQAVAGPVKTGDVIVFQAEELHGGGLTTHRVVGETDRGYITRGDDNPFTDQDGPEPPVKRAQVVAQALQVGGHLVVVPDLGDAFVTVRDGLQRLQTWGAVLLGTRSLLGASGLAYLLFIGSIVYYLASWASGRNSGPERSPTRRTHATGLDARYVVGLFTVLLLVGLTLPMTVPAGTERYGVVSASFTSEKPNVIPVGESKSFDEPVANSGVVPVVVFVTPASEGIEVRPTEFVLAGGERQNATVVLHAGDETGYYRRYLTEHRYLALLPTPLIRSLYTVHPWLPIVVIDALVGVPFYLFGVALLGTGRIRTRSRSRDLPLATRLRRLLRTRE